MSQHLDDVTMRLFAMGEIAEWVAVDIADHLDACPTCTARMESFDPLFAALAAMPDPEPPFDLVEAVLAAAARPERLPIAETVVGLGLLATAAVLVLGFGSPIHALTQAGVIVGVLTSLLSKIPLAGPMAVCVTGACLLSMTALSMAAARMNAPLLDRRLP